MRLLLIVGAVLAVHFASPANDALARDIQFAEAKACNQQTCLNNCVKNRGRNCQGYCKRCT